MSEADKFCDRDAPHRECHCMKVRRELKLAMKVVNAAKAMGAWKAGLGSVEVHERKFLALQAALSEFEEGVGK